MDLCVCEVSIQSVWATMHYLSANYDYDKKVNFSLYIVSMSEVFTSILNILFHSLLGGASLLMVTADIIPIFILYWILNLKSEGMIFWWYWCIFLMFIVPVSSLFEWNLTLLWPGSNQNLTYVGRFTTDFCSFHLEVSHCDALELPLELESHHIELISRWLLLRI